jgi:hypothetical protein
VTDRPDESHIPPTGHDPESGASAADAGAAVAESGAESGGERGEAQVPQAPSETGESVAAPEDPALAAAQSDVATALAGLDDAEGSDAADQVAAFEAVHEALQATLARIDDR